jgi:manganese/iron transport system permease protein
LSHLGKGFPLIDFLLEPLQAAFMQRAILAALLIGITSGVVGAYVVTRGMSFLGDALAHSVLPGVAIAFLTGSNILFGGLVAGVLAAIVIGLLTRRRRLQEDTAIGIVFAGTLAFGIALISTSRSVATDLQHILIGNILAVGEQDLLYMALISLVVLLIIGLLYKELLIISFDQTLAQSLQLPSETLRILLLVLLAITVVVGVQAVGVTLVAATLVTPAATARFFVKRLHTMMLLSAFIASVSGMIGMYIAWYQGIAPSATIVLTMTAFFVLAFFFAPNTGYFWSLLGKSSQKA